MTPTVGRIVLYHDKVRGEEFAGIVTKVFAASVTLYVFYPFGPRMEAFVPHRDESPINGNFWDWPPRLP